MIPEVQTSDHSLTEGQDSSVSIYRIGGTEGVVTVGFRIEPLTIDSRDLAIDSWEGSVLFEEGQQRAEIPLVLIDDRIVEDIESFFVTLTSLSAGDYGQSSLEFQVYDNDRPGSKTSLHRSRHGRVREMVELLDGRVAVAARTEQFFAVLHPDGSEDTSFGAQPNGSVNGVSIDHEGRLLVAGEFTRWGEANVTNLARLHPSGELDVVLTDRENWGPNGPLHRILPYDEERIIICGEFTKFGPVDAAGIARIYTDGTLDPTFDPSVLFATNGSSPSIEELEVLADGKILVASEAFDVSDTSNRRLIRLNSDGAVDPSFLVPNYVLNAELEALLPLPDGSVVVGGYLLGVRKLLSDGSVDPAFKQFNADNRIQELRMLSNGMILATGFFTNIGGGPSSGMAILDAAGKLHTRFVGLSPNLEAIALTRDTRSVYLGTVTNRSSPALWRMTIQPPEKAKYQERELWATTLFGYDILPDESFWAADPDGDGANNYLEYAESTDPLSFDPHHVSIRIASDGSVELFVQRNWAATDVPFSIQTSIDGQLWRIIHDPLTNNSTSKAVRAIQSRLRQRGAFLLSTELGLLLISDPPRASSSKYLRPPQTLLDQVGHSLRPVECGADLSESTPQGHPTANSFQSSEFYLIQDAFPCTNLHAPINWILIDDHDVYCLYKSIQCIW